MRRVDGYPQPLAEQSLVAVKTSAGRGYQAMINQALHEYLGRSPEPVNATDDSMD